MKVFWNQDMVVSAVEVEGAQPAGQMIGGGVGCECGQSRLRGRDKRYCGRPGKKARNKITRKIQVKCCDCVEC